MLNYVLIFNYDITINLVGCQYKCLFIVTKKYDLLLERVTSAGGAPFKSVEGTVCENEVVFCGVFFCNFFSQTPLQIGRQVI